MGREIERGERGMWGVSGSNCENVSDMRSSLHHTLPSIAESWDWERRLVCVRLNTSARAGISREGVYPEHLKTSD